MTLSGHFTLYSVLRQYAELGSLWLSKTVMSKLIQTDLYCQQRKCSAVSLSFWRYKVYPHIRGGSRSLEKRRQTTVESCVNTRAAYWCSLFLFAVCNKLAGSSDVGFERDGRRFR